MRSRSDVWLLVVILAVASATRLTELTLSGLSLDESYTIAVGQRPFGEMLELFSFESNGIMYQLLMWPTLALGESVWLVRLPAAITGVLATAAVYWTGRELLGRNVGLVAAAVMAVHPFAVGLSQQTRYYSLTFLFATLSVGMLARGLKTGSRLDWALYVVTTAAAVYSNTLALLALPATHVSVIWVSRVPWRLLVKPLGTALIATALLIVPQLLLTLEASSIRDPLYHLRSPDLGAAARAAEALVLGNDGAPARAAAIIGVLAVVTLGFALPRAFRYVRMRGMVQALRRNETVVVVWAVFFPVASFVVSQRHPIFGDRYLIVVVPGVCLLIALLLSAIRGPLYVPTVALVVGLLLAPVFTREPLFSDYRGAAALLSETREPGDPLVVIPMERLPALAYYEKDLRAAGGELPVEEWRDTPLPPGVTGYRLPGGYGRKPVAPPTARAISELAAINGRISFVYWAGELGPEATAWLERHCRFTTRPLRALMFASAESCDA